MDFLKRRIYDLGDPAAVIVNSGTTAGTPTPAPGVPVVLDPMPQATDAVIFFYYGQWQALPGKPVTVVSETIPLEFKADFLTDISRAIVFLKGQFLISSNVPVITLGTLPANARPQNQLKIFGISNNIEFYLLVEPTGEVKLSAKDEFNLPDNTVGNAPFSLDIFFKPGTVVQTYTVTQFGNFSRNNCAIGQLGSIEIYQKTYSSTISQAAAQALADIDATFATEGQANANASGICTVIPVYTFTQSADFTRTNCGEGFAGTVVNYSKDYTSTISMADAQTKANRDLTYISEGQANANAVGTCTALLIYTASRTADFIRNNCGSGETGTLISFAKNYTSYISLADAQAKADTDANFATEGQEYANVNGICNLTTWIHVTKLARDLRFNLMNSPVYGEGIAVGLDYNVTIDMGWIADNQGAVEMFDSVILLAGTGSVNTTTYGPGIVTCIHSVASVFIEANTSIGFVYEPGATC